MADPSLCIKLISLVEASDYSTVWGVKSYIWWIVIGILLIVSGLFSASENAYSNCNKYHFRNLANKGKFTAKLICRLIDKFDDTLINILVSNNIVQTFISFLSAMLFYNLCMEMGWGDGIEAVLSTVVVAALVYIVSDTVPKILSKAIPNRMAYVLVYPVTFFGIILYPIIFIFRMLLKLVHKIFKVNDQNLLSKEDLIRSASIAINEEEKDVNDEDKEEKLFESDEEEILSNAFDFDSTKIKQIYTPKEKVKMINLHGLTLKALNKKLLTCDYSRLPVYDKNVNNIVGILVVKSYLEEYSKDKHVDLRSVLEDVIKVDINDRIDDVFRLLNKEKVHLGLVYKNGQYIGIVTMEDILEELIEEIGEASFKEISSKQKQESK